MYVFITFNLQQNLSKLTTHGTNQNSPLREVLNLRRWSTKELLLHMCIPLYSAKGINDVVLNP